MYKIYVNDESVPVDEFEGVTQRLKDDGIDYVERKRLIGSLYRFGSTGAGCDLLVKTEEEAQRARQLINDYQSELISSSRAHYEANRAANRSANRQREWLGWALAIFVIALVLGLSLGIGFW